MDVTGDKRVRAGLLAVVLSVAAAQAGAVPADKRVSAKELVKQAAADRAGNRYEEAYAKLKDAADQKPKDKKIAAALAEVSEYLANKNASAAVSECNQFEIDKCEVDARKAAEYGSTPAVAEAQNRLKQRKKEVQDRYARVPQLVAEARFPEAEAELENLSRFKYLLPNIDADKQRVHGLYIASFVTDGQRAAGTRQWDQAIQAFSTAARMDPSNIDAKRGLEQAQKEKEAFTAFQQAQNAYNSKSYLVAYESNEKALKVFPGRQQYIDLNKKIAVDWIKVLQEDAKKLSAVPESMKDNQKALEALQWVRRLDPRAPNLVENMRDVRLALYGNYVQKASDYQGITDNSRIGLAYLYYQNVQQVNPQGEFGFAPKLKEAQNYFRQKREMQIVINVENVSPAPANFSNVVTARVRSVVEKLSMPDMKIRTLDDYQKNPGEDPLFGEMRPDGKSPTAQVTVGITNYETETTGNDKPVDKPSKFVSGTESLSNPDYEKLQAHYREVRAAVMREKPKPGKATREGYTQEDVSLLEQQLKMLPMQITRDKVADYNYQEYHMAVAARIRMTLEARDMLEKQLLGSDAIDASQEKTATEISGVRDRDVNNLMNRPARLPGVEQLLRDAERDALQQLDAKVKLLVSGYVQRFYNEGEKALREGRTEDAVEMFLCHWYAFRGRLEPPQTQRIRDLVHNWTGFDLTPGSA